jgi:RND family efflux transporter MFP subunit
MNQKSLALVLLAFSLPALAQAPKAAAVHVAKAEMKSLAPSVTATGQVRSRAGADLAAGVGGRLAWVAEPGTKVAKGALVARLDLDEMRLQRAEQAARVTRGELALKSAQRELERLRDAGDAVSRAQLNQAEDARDLAKADLEVARATLQQTQERLSRTELRAPFAGVVSERLKREGEEVARGDLIARVADPEHLEVRLFLPLRHVRAIAAGDRVQVQVGEHRATAPIRQIVPVGDARSQSFEALIDAPQMEPPLAAGSSVRVELPLQAPQQALAVPRDAVVIRADGLAVFKVGADQKARRVPVKTGIAQGQWIEVDGELSAEDPVVVRGGESLHDGDPVQVLSPSSANSAQAAYRSAQS